MVRVILASVLTLSVVLTHPAAAQETGATIAGTVLDGTRAALPGVTVTIRQVEPAPGGSSRQTAKAAFRRPRSSPDPTKCLPSCQVFRPRSETACS
ncbi:MAG: hypothetical protein ACRD2N_01495 [Vicinamibacterales bacterium]